MSRIDQLRDKLAAREGKPGYEDNVRVLKEQIARLEARYGDGKP